MVANKITGQKGVLFTAAYVAKFNEMETCLPDFTNPAIAARAWAEQYEQKIMVQKQLEAAQPKIEFFDAVTDSKDAVPMASVAKVLDIKGFGRNNLFKFLREKKILDKDNIPYQEYVDRGYFRVIEQRFTTSEGEVRINFKTLVFQRGLDYIRKLAMKSNVVSFLA